MKKLVSISIALVVCVTSSSLALGAHGSAFGTLATGKSIGQGKGALGFGVGVADATSVVGWFTYGLSEYSNGRLKLGLIDNDGSDTEITFGADFKYQFWSVNVVTPNPLDMALGGFLEYVDYGAVSAFQLGGHLVGSYPFTLNTGTVLSPYGRFNIRMERVSVQTQGRSNSDSDLEFGLNGGVAWEASPTVTVYGEFQIDGNDGIFFGALFGVM